MLGTCPQCPHIFSDIFDISQTDGRLGIKAKINLIVKNNYGCRLFEFEAVKLFNNLPSDIRNDDLLPIYKSKTLHYLLNSQKT